MAELNQFAISRTLGSTMKVGVRSGFGYTSGLQAVGSALLARPVHQEQLGFSETAERTIIRAFADIAQGRSVDRLLADPGLSLRFYSRCQQLGISATQEAINRRLFVIRKNPRPGIRVPHVTRPVRLESAGEFLFAAEFAMVQLSYRHGASVDDMLANPLLGEEFDRLATALEPRRSNVEHRLTALYIRKRRHFKRVQHRERVSQVPLARIDDRWIDLGSLDDIHLDRAASEEGGLLLVTERGSQPRDLYAAEDEDLQRAAKPFSDVGVYETVADHFWSPRPDQIHLCVAPLGKKYFGHSRHDWLLKLIQSREPIFNLPVHRS
ncbi:MAG: hypothetical protein WBD40_05335 [Tepidisphaeraceae bacterium]